MGKRFLRKSGLVVVAMVLIAVVLVTIYTIGVIGLIGATLLLVAGMVIGYNARKVEIRLSWKQETRYVIPKKRYNNFKFITTIED